MGNQKIQSEINTVLKIGWENIVDDLLGRDLCPNTDGNKSSDAQDFGNCFD